VIVCICSRVSDRDMARAVGNGCATFEALQQQLNLGTRCNRCLEFVQALFLQQRAARQGEGPGTTGPPPRPQP
jgi:bacterioferritin-associated ferredoxin